MKHSESVKTQITLVETFLQEFCKIKGISEDFLKEHVCVEVLSEDNVIQIVDTYNVEHVYFGVQLFVKHISGQFSYHYKVFGACAKDSHYSNLIKIIEGIKNGGDSRTVEVTS